MPKRELDALAEDIKAHGLLEDIVLVNDAIIDGMSRQDACELAGVEARYVELADFIGDPPPLDYAIARNVRRRNLTKSQRAMIGANLAKLARGRPKKDETQYTIETLAGLLDVSVESIKKAKRVDKSKPETARKVRDGERSVKKADAQPDDDDTGPTQDALEVKLRTTQVIDAFAAADELALVVGLLRKAKKYILDNLADSAFAKYVTCNQVARDIDNAISALKFAKPYAQCPECKGSGCEHCRDAGWLPKEHFKRLPTR